MKKLIVGLVALGLVLLGIVGYAFMSRDRLPEPEDALQYSGTAAEQDAGAAQGSTSTTVPSTFTYATLETNRGRIVIQLFAHKAPKTVENFVKLANQGFYNGIKWHRVEPGFVIQAGDPLSKDDDPMNDGTGGPGYTIEAEINDSSHTRGAVAMARKANDLNSAGSQFYVCLSDVPQLDGQYTVFGTVTEGMEVVDAIQAYDVITKVTLEER